MTTRPDCSDEHGSAGEQPLVWSSHLSKVFSSSDMETHALADVELSIERGEFVAITGPSGCGKTTLLSIVGLMETATSGELRIAGRDVTRQSLGQLARLRNQLIGFVFQDFNLIGDLDVLDNVALPLNYGGVPRDQRRQRATAALERVDMQARMSHYPAQLSGGQQQRAAIARAIVGDPPLLLADEPTGNLDSQSGRVVMDLLGEIHAAGTTVCLVTHDTSHAAAAQRQIEMLDGRFHRDSVNDRLVSTPRDGDEFADR